MPVFRFTAGKSFLNYPTHPITIPRSQVRYDAIAPMAPQFSRVDISFRGAHVGIGRICHGTAAFGPHFQIRFDTALDVRGLGFALGTLLKVRISERHGQPQISLDRIGQAEAASESSSAPEQHHRGHLDPVNLAVQRQPRIVAESWRSGDLTETRAC
jgi:hypothetical protein